MDVLDTTIRFSIGLEDVDDLFDDVRQALNNKKDWKQKSESHTRNCKYTANMVYKMPFIRDLSVCIYLIPLPHHFNSKQ